MKDSIETPMCLAFLVCDTVITDAQTGKKSLIGIFNGGAASQFPYMIPQFSIFASLTNGEGETELKVVMSATNSEKVFELKGKLPFPNPLESPEVVFAIRNLVINSAGVYELQLFADDVLVASRLITFREIKQAPNQSNQQS